MGHVFISYSRKDKDYAARLADDLRYHGFDVWIDDRIDYGDQWLDVIFQAIADAAAVVVIMSPDAQKSKWVQKEYLYAEELGKLVLPLKLNGHIFPYFVNVQVGAFTEKGGLPDNFYERLERVTTPQDHTGKIIVAPPPPLEPETVAPIEPTPFLATNHRAWWAGALGVIVVLALLGTVLLSGVLSEGDGNNGSGNSGETRTDTPTETLTDTPTEEPAPTDEPTDEPTPNVVAQADTAIPSPTNTETPTATPTDTASPTLADTTTHTAKTEPSPTTTTTSTPTFTATSRPIATRTATPSPTDTQNLCENMITALTSNNNTSDEITFVQGAMGYNASSTLCLMNVDGANMRKVYSDVITDFFGDDSYLYERPSWSPDGSALAFSYNNEYFQQEIAIINSTKQFSATKSNLSDYSRYYDNFSPVWSPSGDLLAFVGKTTEGNFDIFIMSADGTDQRNLTQSTRRDQDPEWSPDGFNIAYASWNNGSLDIFVNDVNGSNERNLTPIDGHDRYPTWSPDGSLIAFVSERDGNREIYVMNADGTYPRNLTQNSGEDWSPMWSPDGSLIAFVSERDGNKEVYVMNADGTYPRNLTQNYNQDSSFTWSPDGSQIAFASNRDGNFDIYIMDKDGSNPENITDTLGLDEYSPVWRPRPD